MLVSARIVTKPLGSARAKNRPTVTKTTSPCYGLVGGVCGLLDWSRLRVMGGIITRQPRAPQYTKCTSLSVSCQVDLDYFLVGLLCPLDALSRHSPWPVASMASRASSASRMEPPEAHKVFSLALSFRHTL